MSSTQGRGRAAMVTSRASINLLPSAWPQAGPRQHLSSPGLLGQGLPRESERIAAVGAAALAADPDPTIS